MKNFEFGCKPWTKDEDQILILMHEKHDKIADIASFLHRTEEGIRHRKKELKLGRCLKQDEKNVRRRASKKINNNRSNSAKYIKVLKELYRQRKEESSAPKEVQYSEDHIRDKSNWREKIDKLLNEIKHLRKEQQHAKDNSYKHTYMLYEEKIQALKEKVRAIILSRDYEY